MTSLLCVPCVHTRVNPHSCMFLLCHDTRVFIWKWEHCGAVFTCYARGRPGNRDAGEACMNRKNNPHSTVRLKSNDKRAVSRRTRFCWCRKVRHRAFSLTKSKSRLNGLLWPFVRLEFRVRRLILPLETFCDQWSSEPKDPLWAKTPVPDASLSHV